MTLPISHHIGIKTPLRVEHRRIKVHSDNRGFSFRGAPETGQTATASRISGSFIHHGLICHLLLLEKPVLFYLFAVFIIRLHVIVLCLAEKCDLFLFHFLEEQLMFFLAGFTLLFV